MLWSFAAIVGTFAERTTEGGHPMRQHVVAAVVGSGADRGDHLSASTTRSTLPSTVGCERRPR